MKRQKIQILVMVAVLVVLGGAFFGIQAYKKYRAKQIFEKTPSVLVVDAVQEDMTALAYTYEGEKLSFERENGTWYLAGDHGQKLAQYRITGMTRVLSELEAIKVIENVTDLTLYGLDDPEMTVWVSAGSADYTLLVGDKNEMTGDYYVCYPSGDTVYTVTSDFVVRFRRPLEKLLEGSGEEDGEP